MRGRDRDVDCRSWRPRSAGRAQSERTYVIAIRTSAYDWTEGGSFWEVGLPEVSERSEILAARAAMEAGKAAQRVGW